MKTDKKVGGIAHAIFDHSSSIEELKEAIATIKNGPNAERAEYELHHQDSSGLELEAGLQEALRIPDDYRIMSHDLRKEYPPESRALSEHKYVLVAKSGESHEATAEELSQLMNQLHLLNYDTRIFRGGIIHKDEEREGYHLK